MRRTATLSWARYERWPEYQRGCRLPGGLPNGFRNSPLARPGSGS
jgi:hypothetical protein